MRAPSIRRGWQFRTGAIGIIGVVVLVPTVLIGLVYVGLFLRSMVRLLTLPHLIALLFLWQAQMGAAFALAAALIGAIAIVRQTEATERRAEERRQRRATALRAVLPLLLSELNDYAASCANIFAQVLESNEDAPWTWPTGKAAPGSTTFATGVPVMIPPLPSGLVGQLIDLIETIPPDHARPLVTLVKRVQIQHSRALALQQRILSPRQGQMVVRSNVLACLIDAIEVHARCARLFPYARGEIMAPPAVVSTDDVQGSALLAVYAPVLDEVAAQIDHYATTQTSWPNQP
jgi:hypothetical protein